MLYKSQVSVTHHESLPYVRALHELINSVFLINLTLVGLISRAPVIEPKREAEKTFFLFSCGCTYMITVYIRRDIDLIYWLRKTLWRRPQVTGQVAYQKRRKWEIWGNPQARVGWTSKVVSESQSLSSGVSHLNHITQKMIWVTIYSTLPRVLL